MTTTFEFDLTVNRLNTTTSLANDLAVMMETSMSVGCTIQRWWTRHQRWSGLWFDIDVGTNIVDRWSIRRCWWRYQCRSGMLLGGDVFSITATLGFDPAVIPYPSPPLRHFFRGVFIIITAICFHNTNDLDRSAVYCIFQNTTLIYHNNNNTNSIWITSDPTHIYNVSKYTLLSRHGSIIQIHPPWHMFKNKNKLWWEMKIPVSPPSSEC